MELSTIGDSKVTPNELRQLCDARLHVPLWPDAARALGLGRWSAYDQARRGKIATIEIGHRKRVPTSWLRRQFSLEVAQ